MEIVTPEVQWQLGLPGTSIRVWTSDGGVEEVGWEDGNGEERHVGKVRFPETNTARVYKAFAKGKRGRYADYEDVVVRYGILDVVVASAAWP